MENSIASASIRMNQMQLQSQVQTALLSKAMDAEKAQGQAMVDMIQSAGSSSATITDPARGRFIDMLA